jgi:hypothetical protein
MEDWLIAVIALGTLLVGFLVYWFVIRKPSAPSSSCTAGTDCSSNVSTKDPQWLSYLWDSSCNCNLVSCQSGYIVSGGKCVASSGPTPPPDPTPPPPPPDPTPDPYSSWLAINGLVNGETEDYVKTGVKDLKTCQDFCTSKQNDCKVFDLDATAGRCVVFKDYRSVRGYGEYSSHFIDRVIPDGTRMTYVRPFASNDPEMGSKKNAQMAWLKNADIANNKPYATCDYFDDADCASQCLYDDKCEAVHCSSDSTCVLYSDVADKQGYVSNIVPGSNWTFLKIKSTL